MADVNPMGMSELEMQIVRTARDAITKAIESALIGYSSPMTEMVNRVVRRHEAALDKVVDEAIAAATKSEDFANELRRATTTKIASTLIQRLGGEIEKKVNELKSSPTTRARITLAIEELVNSK